MSTSLPVPAALAAPVLAGLAAGTAREGLDFEALRSAGIAALQQLCGARWTDFNAHDPGVTVLEQLAYSLTDLAYRTGFDMADYLTGPDGTIDYANLALHPPEAVLPAAALTVDDYRRLLYGALPDLADIWVRPAGDGLLAVDVMGADAIVAAVPGREPEATPGPLGRQVRALYAGHRALGEDLLHVREVRPRPYYLRGEIDTCGERDPAEVLARILHDCDEYLSSGMSVRRMRDVIAQGLAPEMVYDGPATRHGHVVARPAATEPVTVSELIGVIQRIEGVRRIRALAILDEHLQPCAAIVRDSESGTCPVLPFPDDDATIELLRLQPEQGIEYGVSEQLVPPGPAWHAANRLLYDEARLELAKLRFEQRAFRGDAGGAGTRYPLPQGRYRELRAYYSVQHEFPAVYGVGKYGLPESASAARQVQARQLQGFLYPMEQLMANYLQNLQDLPALFALDGADRRSYFAQYLDGAALPGMAELYRDEDVPQRIHRALARQDDYYERKGRVYDYLLALHGDAFPQTALRRFNQYHPTTTGAWLLEAKRRLLAAQVALGAGRGRGGDYTLPPDAPGAVAPLAWRVAILVGFDGGERSRSLCPAQDGRPVTLQEHDEDVLPPPAPADWLPLPPPRDEAPVPGIVPERLLPEDGVPEGLLRDGALLSGYRLARDGGDYLLYVQAGAGWRLLGRYGRRADAIGSAHAAVARLAALNRQCEGLHLVEHILLRPVDPQRQPPFNPAFYHARLSVVLPRWTVRCADRAFRNFVEETVRENCPAHLQPNFLWLAPAAMARFEALRDAWRAALRAYHTASDDEMAALAEPLHEACGAMVAFLREYRTEPT
ncbi:hypothetical protein [Pseudoduganella chitinolytica]|uniref:Uncharacterized protein n=1 Tax=Pseudoduganella chitinolytica TaxID=34070 RepID=A0ABY8BHZ6_9BURK|nr:hypothetical protein [Pseudoduganella chitinolytica]WEF34312.1 hypothetical protein PX653_05935 [Pseudoduganella chitinolytica]